MEKIGLNVANDSNYTTEDFLIYHKILMDRLRKNIRKPNLFGVGAGRSGTSTLYGLLKKSEDVCVSPIKEVNYFGINQYPFQRNGLTELEYLTYFLEQNDELWTCEITPAYLTRPQSIEAIKEFSPNAKIIITLRDPIDRCISQFKHHSAQHGIKDVNEYFDRGLKNLGIHDFMSKGWFTPQKNIAQSRYGVGVGRIMQLFGQDSCLVLHYETLSTNPVGWISDIEDFLDINLEKDLDSKYRNESHEGGYNLDPKIEEGLRNLFVPDLRKLKKILGDHNLPDYFADYLS